MKSLATATDAARETERWPGPLFIAMIFSFVSIAVINTLAMIALRRGAGRRFCGSSAPPGLRCGRCRAGRSG